MTVVAVRSREVEENEDKCVGSLYTVGITVTQLVFNVVSFGGVVVAEWHSLFIVPEEVFMHGAFAVETKHPPRHSSCSCLTSCMVLLAHVAALVHLFGAVNECNFFVVHRHRPLILPC